jgi:hypothetical protein
MMLDNKGSVAFAAEASNASQAEGRRGVYRTPSASAKYGIVYPSLSPTPSPANYYDSLAILMSDLRTPAWVNSGQGFYVSSVDLGVPRLSYFSASADRTCPLVDAICLKTGLRQVKPAQPLSAVKYVDNYGGTETVFRRYLCDYTQIGLDLLNVELETAQRLCATYRWRVHPSGGDARGHFESTLQRVSETYRAFSTSHRDAFWRSFAYGELGRTPWDHMFVNQILCFDKFVQAPLSCSQITALLASNGHTVEVPDGWTP